MPTMSIKQALNEALREEMRADPDVFIMGEEVAEYQGAYKVTEGLLAEFGSKRVIDTPISEEVIVGAGVGAAMAGLKPVVEMMTINFALLALDQIVNHAAKYYYMSGGQYNIPLVVRAASGVGLQLGAQHSQNFESWFVHVPGLKVVLPATSRDAKGLLKSAIRDPDPVIFLEHELIYLNKSEVPDGDFTVPLGVADVKREGTDVTIITYSRMVLFALKAAERLAKEGISVEVIDLRTLRPLDTRTVIDSVKKTHRAVVAEEDWPMCGMGAELIAQIQQEAFDYLDAPVERVSGVDVPMPYAKNLEKMAVPGEEELYSAVKRVMQGV
ncbi:MAG: pyruvate dehydrogenase complex E1 component subunit beta [Armatimonadetes bacterium]|nr:pyruvate dehydrogenase complex E1 component subunit beta [Armatimonadota bacterium]